MQLHSLDGLAGLDTPDGRSFKPDARGVITLPEQDAANGRLAAKADPFRPYRQPFTGFDAAELRARYEAWAAAHGR